MGDITNNMKNLSLDKRTFFLELIALLTILIKSTAALFASLKALKSSFCFPDI